MEHSGLWTGALLVNAIDLVKVQLSLKARFEAQRRERPSESLPRVNG